MRLFVTIIALLLVAGCSDLPFGRPAPYPEKTGDGSGPTLWLNFSLVNLGDETRFADLGPHCGTARSSTEWASGSDGSWTTRDTYESVFIEEKEYGRLGQRRPFLIVDSVEARNPSSGSQRFATIGQEGFAARFPFTLDPHMRKEPGPSSATPIAKIDYVGGGAMVDGERVSLPHTWTRSAPGNWSAEFHLSLGPSKVELFRIENCA